MSFTLEDKSCCKCKYEDRDTYEEPCKNCQNNFVIGTKEFYEHDLLWEFKLNETDNVNHPSHYNQGGIECIDAMIAAFGKEAVKNFCMCNAFKYIWRSAYKNGLEDVEKSHWYLNKYEELCSDE